MFETGLDTSSYWITNRKSKTIEFLYSKPKFESRSNTIGIWAAIVLGEKDPIHFIHKRSRMNSEM